MFARVRQVERDDVTDDNRSDRGERRIEPVYEGRCNERADGRNVDSDARGLNRE